MQFQQLLHKIYGDVIQNEQGCKILSNSEFAMILKQKTLDLPAICKIFDISDEESKYVIDSPARTTDLLCMAKIKLHLEIKYLKISIFMK